VRPGRVLAGPSEFSDIALRRQRFAALRRFSQDWLPAQSTDLNAYRCYGFSDPAAPF